MKSTKQDSSSNSSVNLCKGKVRRARGELAGQHWLNAESTPCERRAGKEQTVATMGSRTSAQAFSSLLKPSQAFSSLLKPSQDFSFLGSDSGALGGGNLKYLSVISVRVVPLHFRHAAGLRCGSEVFVAVRGRNGKVANTAACSPCALRRDVKQARAARRGGTQCPRVC